MLGLVYGAGVEVDPVEELVRSELDDFGYQVETIHLSDFFPEVLSQAFSEDSPNATRRLQDMGDELRRRGGLDAIARLAVFLIAAHRQRLEGEPERIAWLIRSLRRPEEVHYLRQVYGPRFILLGIHVPESRRLANLTDRRRRVSPTTSGPFDVEAIEDIRRDEQDLTKPYGQSMRTTFAEADFVVDARSQQRLRDTLPRVVEVIFGDPFVTPTREEQAMYQAYAAGLRSAEMGRQVGAAVIDRHGELLSIGTNEVPAGGGGLYWYPDEPDGRDFAQPVPVDSNTEWKRRVAREVLVRLSQGSGNEAWLKGSRVRRIDGELIVEEEQLLEFLRLMNGTRFADLIEFGRAVHAEMDAVTGAARRGISLAGTTLVCTTFPCHNCCRHIVSAGIRRVIYLYPYVKSLARELHADALAVDPEDSGGVAETQLILEQFIGVTPRGFAQYFDFSRIDRKDDVSGRAYRLTERSSIEPRVVRSYDTWAFGGPAVGSDLLAEVERQAATKAADLLTGLELSLPEV